jgi:hypothetical protein
MITTAASPDCTLLAGSTYDLDAALAKAFIKGGYAELPASGGVETAAVEPSETRAAKRGKGTR